MKKWGLFLLLCTACAPRGDKEPKLISLQLIDRHGFQETISTADRLSTLNKTDYLQAQPYQKVVRLFSPNREGKKESIVTSYHDNGQLWQYLETVNGRARGAYREWYPSGTLKVEARTIEGMGDVTDECVQTWLFHGETKAFDSEGNLEASITYDRGDLHGNARYFFPSGQLKKSVPYYRGFIEGTIHYYDEKGTLIGKAKHKKGVQEGLTVYLGTKESPRYTEHFKEGKLQNATYYDFDGNVVAEVTNGFGTQAVFEKGALREIHEVREGEIEGAVTQYNRYGELTCTFTIVGGKKHGEETLYYAEKKPRMRIDWYEDEMHGKVKTWYASGTLESERDIYNNKKHGNALAWYCDGSLMLMEEYEHDKLAKGAYYKKGDLTPVSHVEEGSGTATLFDAGGQFLRRIAYYKGQPIDE